VSPRQAERGRGHRRGLVPASLLAATGMLMLASVVAAADASVAIRDFAFQPATVTVRVGDTVTWTNRDDVVHTVQWSGGSESPDLENGERYSRTFTSTGTFAYICGPHPFMTGSVRVLAATGGNGGGGGQPGTDTVAARRSASPSLLLPALLAVLGGLGLLAARVASRREGSETGGR
jgi:plastocyanin